MDQKRKRAIRDEMKRAVLSRIEEDLNGNDELFKDAWESCDDDEELNCARLYLGRIARAVKSLKVAP